MGEHLFPGTCLSTVPHGLWIGYDGRMSVGGNVRDILLHYFGCLRGDGKLDANRLLLQERELSESEEKNLRRYYQRQKFFDSLPEHEKHRIMDERQRIDDLRKLLELDDETRGLVLRFEKSLQEWRPGPARVSRESLPEGDVLHKENAFGLSAHMMLFKDRREAGVGGYTGVADQAFPENFPNQKIPLKDLLYNRDGNSNPLTRPCSDGMIRYFHLPENNMEWIEEAIARYYAEERPYYDDLYRQPENPTKSYMILQPALWRGQQQGGRGDAVYARQMRPRCERMSTNPRHLEESPNNLALFMPYLHWETDRSRYKLEESMRRITEWHRTKEELKTREFKRFEEIEFLDPERPLLRLSTATETVQARLHHELRIHPMSKVSRTGVARELTGRILVPATLLGRVLYRAAKLWEAMNYYKEEHVLKEFLHNSPPLHPRRTLDQSYYWTLRSTQKKARDQVVYRGTAPKKQFMHKMHCKTFTKEPPCRQCLDDIRKRSRVIMVDQLWLWILDGNTIITSFPKRYGRDNEDTSDVHKCIRLRLKVARQNEIRSIYDLALIIIDECSKGMFDHAKTGGQQPQMMTLFADAISNVKDRTALYYENFWDITSRLSMAYKDQIPMVDAAKDARSLLDINPEGYLSTTIKNVVDELNIILDIKSNQQKALKDFQKHVDYILAPYMTIARDIGIDKQRGDERRVSTDSEERTKMDTQISRAAEKDAKWTMESSIRVSADLENRIIDLSHLKESAENIEKAVDGLLGLKQQQAGVVQAREAVRQAEETLRQGRSIMLFTVITIIFLPLTFGTGIFGMNLETFGSTWTLRKEITYITFVSAIVIATSIVLAFSSFVRSLLSLVFGVVWMWFVTTTRIYDLWYSFRQDSGFLARKQLDITRKWKEVARERYFLRQARKRERQEEKLKKLEAKLLKKEKEYLQGGRGRQAAQARDSTLTVLAV